MEHDKIGRNQYQEGLLVLKKWYVIFPKKSEKNFIAMNVQFP